MKSFVLLKFRRLYSVSLLLLSFMTIFLASKYVTVPSFFATTTRPVSFAASSSIPVATSGASGIRHGVACLCMLLPIRARLASSFSINGIIEVATENAWLVAISIKSTSARSMSPASPAFRTSTNSSTMLPSLSHLFAACAILYCSSSNAFR